MFLTNAFNTGIIPGSSDDEQRLIYVGENRFFIDQLITLHKVLQLNISILLQIHFVVKYVFFPSQQNDRMIIDEEEQSFIAAGNVVKPGQYSICLLSDLETSMGRKAEWDPFCQLYTSGT